MKKHWLVLGVLLIAMPAQAQPRKAAVPAPPGAIAAEPGPQRERNMFETREGREMLEQVMVARLSRELELSDEETIILVRRLTRLREDLMALRKKKQGIMEELAKAVEARADVEIARHLDALQAFESESLETKRSAFEEVASDMAPWQRGRLYLFLQNFDQDMRRLIERARARVHEKRELQGPRRDRGLREAPAPPESTPSESRGADPAP